MGNQEQKKVIECMVVISLIQPENLNVFIEFDGKFWLFCWSVILYVWEENNNDNTNNTEKKLEQKKSRMLR